MKKILVLSSLALVLTACSNDTGSKSKPVVNKTTTSEKVEEIKKSEEQTKTEEKSTSEKQEESKDVFKETLENPSKHFNVQVSNVKYLIKNADTQYLLLIADSTLDKGMKTVKIFAYDKDKKTVVTAGEDIMLGVAGVGGFRGGLNEYTDSPNKFRYVTISSGSGDYTMEDIVLSGGKVKKENVIEGSLRSGEIPKGNVKEITWQEIGSSQKPKDETTTEKKEEKSEEKKSDSKKEESSSNSLSSEKSEALVKGMKAFGEKMNQVPYEKTDVPDKLTWQSGGDVEGYKIYESYIYKSGATTHRYFFVTNSSGTPEVLYSTGGTSVKHTANADIVAMFRGVHGGSASSEKSEMSKSSGKAATYKTRDNKTITMDDSGNITLYGRLHVPYSNEGGVIGFDDTSLPSTVTSATMVKLIPAGVTNKYTEEVKGKDDVSKERIIVSTVGAGPAATEIYFKEGESKQESKPAKSSKLDLDAISKGDFSSMTGAHGSNFNIDKSTISFKGRQETIREIKKEGNIVKIGLPMAWFVVVPAGEPKPHVQGWTGEGFENDDQSRDRAYIFGEGVALVFLD